MDTQIDVDRWVCAAEAEICEIDGALNALGAEPTPEGIDLHGLANLDAPGVAAYLRGLAAKLQVVATNLTYLADNADLTGLAGGLKSSQSSTVSNRVTDATVEDFPTGRSSGPGSDARSRSVDASVEELLAALDDSVDVTEGGA